MKLPDDFTLRTMLPGEREALLREVVASDALHALTQVDAIGFEATLHSAAQRGSLGALVDRVGLEPLLALGASHSLNVNDVLASTDTVTLRGLTRHEALRIAEVFEHSLDPATVRFHFSVGAQTMGAGALVLGNVIHVDPTDPRWGLGRGATINSKPEDNSFDSFNAVLLAHEPTHVWSYQHQGSRYAVNSINEQLAAVGQTGSRGGAYSYKPDRQSLWEFGEEQRAMLVQDFVVALYAQRRGSTHTLTRYGGFLKPADVLATLGGYLRELRGAGPGQAEPVGQPERIFCPAGHSGFAQDGALDALAQQANQLVAEVGHASVAAVTKGTPLERIAGVAGVTAAVTASVISREQNATGASSGGSAVLDQAGIPHGLEGTHGPFTGTLRADWSAPSPTKAGPTIGLADARVTSGLRVTHEVGDATVAVGLESTLDRDAHLRRAAASASVHTDRVDGSAQVELTPETRDTPLVVDGGLEVTSPGLSVMARASVEAQRGRIERVDASAAVETRVASLTTDAHFSRAAADAPLALEQATAGLTLTPSPNLSVNAQATVVPAGVDALSAKVATVGDRGTLSIGAHARDLTTAPTLGIDLAAKEKKSGVELVASAETTPSTGATQVGVNVKVPL